MLLSEPAKYETGLLVSTIHNEGQENRRQQHGALTNFQVKQPLHLVSAPQVIRCDCADSKLSRSKRLAPILLSLRLDNIKDISAYTVPIVGVPVRNLARWVGALGFEVAVLATWDGY